MLYAFFQEKTHNTFISKGKGDISFRTCPKILNKNGYTSTLSMITKNLSTNRETSTQKYKIGER